MRRALILCNDTLASRYLNPKLQLLTFKRFLLPPQIFLTGVLHRHVTSVDAEAWRLARWTQVIMWRPAIPHNEVTRLSTNLLPLEAAALEPLHAGVGEAVPLLGPRPHLLLLVRELAVELLAGQVRALADDQAAVVGPIAQHVEQALQAAEAGLARVLVLVRPRRVRGHIVPVREREVHGVEADDQVFVAVHFREGRDDARFLTHVPHELLVRDPVPVAHALLVDHGQVCRRDC